MTAGRRWQPVGQAGASRKARSNVVHEPDSGVIIGRRNVRELTAAIA
jgi:hypothetical protein